MIAGGCNGSASTRFAAIPSPDGTMTLTPSITESTDTTQNGCLAFDIVDARGNQLCHVQTKASNTMKWALNWHDAATVVLSSSDIGTRAWKVIGGKATELPLPLPPELLPQGKELASDNSSSRDRVRFPDASIGNWVDLTKVEEISICLEDISFHPVQPLPDEGYVPVEATGPTIRATARNATNDYLAEMRIRVRAIDAAGALLAEEVTATPGRYYLIPPRTAKPRTFVFDSPHTKFVNSEEWRDFSVSVDVLAVRFVSAAQVGAGE
jgi:hypothetical protein